jgi:hypothetical protein
MSRSNRQATFCSPGTVRREPQIAIKSAVVAGLPGSRALEADDVVRRATIRSIAARAPARGALDSAGPEGGPEDSAGAEEDQWRDYPRRELGVAITLERAVGSTAAERHIEPHPRDAFAPAAVAVLALVTFGEGGLLGVVPTTVAGIGRMYSVAAGRLNWVGTARTAALPGATRRAERLSQPHRLGLDARLERSMTVYTGRR